MKTNVHLCQYHAEFFLESEVFHTKVVEKIKIHILLSRTFPENGAVYEIMWKNTVGCRPIYTIVYKRMYSICMLHNI
jgi:hypothetical protein